jgi:cell division protein FtsN
MTFQKGGFAMGLVAGLLIGLALALGVALYITKAPVPFVNKVPQRTAEQDKAETERNRDWDPNAALGGKAAARAANAASAASAAGATAAPASALPAPGIQPATAVPAAAVPSASAAAKPARDPAAILAGEPAAAPAQAPAPRSTVVVPEPFVFYVQAGAFTRTEDAEQQRAKLAMIGQAAKITEREQAGRTVFRVRLGPFPLRNDADALQTRLQEQGIESQIVRVEKP